MFCTGADRAESIRHKMRSSASNLANVAVAATFLDWRYDDLFAFFEAITVCHTCLPTKSKDGGIKYEGPSPDEVSLRSLTHLTFPPLLVPLYSVQDCVLHQRTGDFYEGKNVVSIPTSAVGKISCGLVS